MLVPSTQKLKGHSSNKNGQHRSRRPIFVVEVEALVHEIELLGIRRYNAINKWETLVHTTTIPP